MGFGYALRGLRALVLLACMLAIGACTPIGRYYAGEDAPAFVAAGATDQRLGLTRLFGAPLSPLVRNLRAFFAHALAFGPGVLLSGGRPEFRPDCLPVCRLTRGKDMRRGLRLYRQAGSCDELCPIRGNSSAPKPHKFKPSQRGEVALITI